MVAIAGPAAATVLTQRRAATASGRPDAAAGRAHTLRRLVTETGLVLVAVAGLIVLRDQGLGPAGADVYPAAAPILAAVPVAIVVLRAYPLVVRGLFRVTGGTAGASAYVGLARAVRVSASAVLPAFAMVLALGLVSFAGMVRGAVVRGEVASSWQQAGADAVVTSPIPVTPALQRAAANVSGRLRGAAGIGAVGYLGRHPFGVLRPRLAQYAAFVGGTPLPAVPAAFTAAGHRAAARCRSWPHRGWRRSSARGRSRCR